MKNNTINSHDWLTRLIAFDTTSRNSNLALIDNIREWLELHDINVRLTHDANKRKANIFATLPAQDGTTDNGIILSGHTDVVPVDGQSWNTDPFVATTIDERIYGRGACDMKGFIAVVLSLVPEFKRLKLIKPIHLAFSYDEEVTCDGARNLIKDMLQHGIKAAACIVGEPTEMRPVVAHKGIQVFRCRLQGHAVHSSLTSHGCNAIEYAAQFITWLRNLANQFRQQGPFDPFYDVPFTTLTTNMIQGGNAINTVPAVCEFFFELRNLPEIQPDDLQQKIKKYIHKDLLPKMRSEFPEATIEMDSIAVAPALEISEKEAITQLTRRITQEKEVTKVSYATEAGLFHQAGIPTIVCGPGNIEQAHRANEFVSLEQLSRCEKFLRELVKQNI